MKSWIQALALVALLATCAADTADENVEADVQPLLRSLSLPSFLPLNSVFKLPIMAPKFTVMMMPMKDAQDLPATFSSFLNDMQTRSANARTGGDDSAAQVARPFSLGRMLPSLSSLLSPGSPMFSGASKTTTITNDGSKTVRVDTVRDADGRETTTRTTTAQKDGDDSLNFGSILNSFFSDMDGDDTQPDQGVTSSRFDNYQDADSDEETDDEDGYDSDDDLDADDDDEYDDDDDNSEDEGFDDYDDDETDDEDADDANDDQDASEEDSDEEDSDEEDLKDASSPMVMESPQLLEMDPSVQKQVMDALADKMGVSSDQVVLAHDQAAPAQEESKPVSFDKEAQLEQEVAKEEQEAAQLKVETADTQKRIALIEQKQQEVANTAKAQADSATASLNKLSGLEQRLAQAAAQPEMI